MVRFSNRIIFGLLCILLAGCATKSAKQVSRDPFLHPYVEQLKSNTAPSDLEQIKGMAESELILLLHGYGTGIRNKWIHGNRDPQLLQFFHQNRIDDPEAASMILIEALWNDLNKNLTPTERSMVVAKRASVARRRASYEKLEAECEVQLAKAKSDFEQCYGKYGPPAPQNPVERTPFFHLLIDKSGRVREIAFYEGAAADLKQCLEERIREFKFSTFVDDDFVTLYILEFPHCRIAERDKLHE